MDNSASDFGDSTFTKVSISFKPSEMPPSAGFSVELLDSSFVPTATGSISVAEDFFIK